MSQGTPDIPNQSLAQRALFANLRHELRTPINAIIGYSEMLLEELEEQVGEESFVGDLQKIQSCGTQLLSLVNTILDPAKLENSQFNLDIAAFGETIRLELRTPLTAAIGYCELLIEEASDDLVADLERIHTAAQRLLGMINDIIYLSQHQLQGGNAYKAGALDLTLANETASTLAEQVVTTIRSLEKDVRKAKVIQQGTILLVDDNETNRDLLSRQLERQGYTVAVAHNGQQALHMMETGNYDLILLDIIMSGMNGYEVLEKLKSHATWCHVPVMMISALDEIDSVVQCIERGAEDYLPKPFNPVILRAKIGACLEKKRLRDQEALYLAQISQAHEEITALNRRLNAENAQLNQLNEELQVQIAERQRVEEALRLEKENSDSLLLNILPRPVANRLKQDPGTIAHSFDIGTVLFADIVGFTELSSGLPPIELVEILNVIFSEFDELSDRYGLEKIKTIGDAYMVVGGVPLPREDHADAIAAMALDMQAAISQFNEETGVDLSIRIGINTGPVVAGVIGLKKFVYDLWGDTVNIASRMESQGIAGETQVTETTYKLLSDQYIFEQRGTIAVKGKGQMTTYLLMGKKVLDSQALVV